MVYVGARVGLSVGALVGEAVGSDVGHAAEVKVTVSMPAKVVSLLRVTVKSDTLTTVVEDDTPVPVAVEPTMMDEATDAEDTVTVFFLAEVTVATTVEADA